MTLGCVLGELSDTSTRLDRGTCVMLLQFSEGREAGLINLLVCK